MKPSKHVIASVALGAGLGFFTKSLYAGMLTAISGIFVDSDHFIEYVIHYGWKNLTYKNVYEASVQTGKREGDMRFKKIYLVFHTGEIAILFWIAAIYTGNIYFLAVAMGYTLHLVLDSTGNPIHPFSHFIIWRAIKGFNTDKLFKKEFKEV